MKGFLLFLNICLLFTIQQSFPEEDLTSKIRVSLFGFLVILNIVFLEILCMKSLDDDDSLLHGIVGLISVVIAVIFVVGEFPINGDIKKILNLIIFVITGFYNLFLSVFFILESVCELFPLKEKKIEVK